jgi:hypothetical protein
MRIYRLRGALPPREDEQQKKGEPLPLDERIRRYIGKIEPAISGQLGHRQTFFVARALVHGFDLSKEAALPFLREYSQRCEPPWNEEELEHKLTSAEKWKPKTAQKPRGHLK